MTIYLNDNPKEISENCTIQQLVDSLYPEAQQGLAVALNESIIPKKDWEHTLLSDTDHLLIIRATQGG